MLKKLLTPEQCAKCRICCGFTESDRWEIPLLAGEDEQNAAKMLGAEIEAVKGTSCAVLSMMFHGEDLVFCPALGDNGCRLGEKRPFDCRIWPFRVMDFHGANVITLSPVCPEVIKLPLSTLVDFLNTDGFADRLFKHAEEFPETVKPYIPGYPILCTK